MLLDLSSVFDMINNSILVDRLESIGIQVIVLKWLRSFLSNRESQLKSTTIYLLTHRVPQGSILSPILFDSLYYLPRNYSQHSDPLS